MSTEQGRVMVHLTYKSGNGKDLAACVGEGSQYLIMGAKLAHPGFQLTGEPSAVTCPACKKTAVFHQVQAGAPK